MDIDREAYRRILSQLSSARAEKVLRHILEHGGISTYEIEQLGYGHPPRAAQDLKEAGVALRTVFREVHPVTGNRMGTYLLANPAPITRSNFGGRAALPKKLERELYAHYGSKCNMDSYEHGARALQADHRVPYIVAGDPMEFRLQDWQLLCGSHQRQKSFECENCPNLEARQADVCLTCFWASPESYEHVATRPIRRLDITWGPEDLAVYEALQVRARKLGRSLESVVKELIARPYGDQD